MNDLLSIKEASAYLGVKESWLRSAVWKKTIKFIKLQRLVRFRKSDLEEFIAKNTSR